MDGRINIQSLLNCQLCAAVVTWMAMDGGWKEHVSIDGILRLNFI